MSGEPGKNAKQARIKRLQKDIAHADVANAYEIVLRKIQACWWCNQFLPKRTCVYLVQVGRYRRRTTCQRCLDLARAAQQEAPGSSRDEPGA